MPTVHAAGVLHTKCDWAYRKIVSATDARNVIREYHDESLGWLRPIVNGKGVRKGNERHDLLRWLCATLFGIPGHVLEECFVTDEQRENMLRPFVEIGTVGRSTNDVNDEVITITITGNNLKVTVR